MKKRPQVYGVSAPPPPPRPRLSKAQAILLACAMLVPMFLLVELIEWLFF